MGTTGYIVGAVLLAAAGGATLRAGLLERELASAQERVVAGDYQALEPVLEKAERFYAYFGRIPWIGSGSVDIAAQKTALQYWQRRYAGLSKDAGVPADTAGDNLELQFMMANAQYRDGAAGATDRPAIMAAVETGIAGYLAVLRNAARHEDAAFNYEYLLRVREDLQKGRRKTAAVPESGSPHGQSGAPQKQQDMQRFKVYVPLEGKEIEKSPAGEAGKAAPMKRKG